MMVMMENRGQQKIWILRLNAKFYFCEEITACSEQEGVSHKTTNIIPSITAESRAMPLLILEVSSLDLDPETFYSNKNTRSFCLIHVGSFWHLNLKLAPINFLYVAEALLSVPLDVLQSVFAISCILPKYARNLKAICDVS